MDIFKLEEQTANVKLDKAVGIGIAHILKTDNLGVGVAKIEKKVGAHFHRESDEVYLILEGEGIIHSGKPREDKIVDWAKPEKVKRGDLFLTPKGTVHSLENMGEKELIIAFFSSPPVKAEDRIMVEQ